MAQLRQDYPKFVAANAEVVAIGPEAAGPFARWWHEHDMPFVGIPDPQHVIAGLYGQRLKLLKGGRMPAWWSLTNGPESASCTTQTL